METLKKNISLKQNTYDLTIAEYLQLLNTEILNPALQRDVYIMKDANSIIGIIYALYTGLPIREIHLCKINNKDEHYDQANNHKNKISFKDEKIPVKGSELLILDGQQRSSVLNEVFKEKSDDKQLYIYLPDIYNDEFEIKSLRFFHTDSSKIKDELWFNLSHILMFIKVDNKNIESEITKYIKDNYLTNSIKTQKGILDSINKIIEILKTRTLHIVEIECNKDKAVEIFRTLNEYSKQTSATDNKAATISSKTKETLELHYTNELKLLGLPKNLANKAFILNATCFCIHFKTAYPRVKTLNKDLTLTDEQVHNTMNSIRKTIEFIKNNNIQLSKAYSYHLLSCFHHHLHEDMIKNQKQNIITFINEADSRIGTTVDTKAYTAKILNYFKIMPNKNNPDTIFNVPYIV